MTAQFVTAVVRRGHGPVHQVPEATVPELFAARVSEHPSAPALLHDDAGLITFAELDARANRLARKLVDLGAGPERVVGVALPRSVEAIVAMVAVLKAGAAYLPMNVDHPPARLAAMVADAAPVAVLATTDGVDPGGPVLRWETLAVDNYPDTDLTDADRIAPLRQEHPLYLIYTSGSTGVPKGVTMPATSLVNLLAWHGSTFPVGPGTRTANLSSIGFDVGMHEILASLVHGKCLVVPTEEVRTDPVRLVGWLDRNRVNQVFLPNVLIESLGEAALATGAALADLRDIVQSGEPLVLGDAVREFLRTRRELRIHNHYGAAEFQDATVWSTGRSLVPTIGTPLWNVRVYVLDDDLRLVPDGEVGGLYVAGAGLARGYSGQPGRTAECYLPDPFGERGDRMYRTGDLASWNANGELECHGRQDKQVKINGVRLDVGEVETRLREQLGVKQAVVAQRHADNGVKQLVGYVVGDGVDPDPVGLRAALALVLPSQMVPTSVVVLSELPVTVNGKVDLRALPDPRRETGATEAETPAQQAIVDAFAEVLGVAAGLDDDFVGLGGDSLGAVRLVVRARRAGLAIGIRDVFELGTPRGLAAQGGATVAQELPVRPLVVLRHQQLSRVRAAHPNVAEILPVTPVQQGFLFQQLQDSDAYTEQVRVDLVGRVHPADIRSALVEAIRRHPPLRAAFLAEGMPDPVQVVLDEVDPPWLETDLTALEPTEALAEAEAIAARSKATRFDVRTAPLLRLRLIQLPGHAAQLVLDYHHILLDGWSVTLLLGELLGLAPVRPVPPLREWFRGVRAKDQVAAAAAWRSSLNGISAPTVLGSGEIGVAPSGRHVIDLSAATTATIVELARTERLTINTIVTAVWGVVLAAETGGRHAVFGTTVSGRWPEVTGVDQLVAMLVNTVPVAVQVDSAESARELLHRTRARQLALVPHEHLGLGAIRRLLSWDTEFDTLLVFENSELLLADPRVGAVRHSDDTHYAISLLVTPGESMRLAFTYRPDRIDRDRVERVAATMSAVLHMIAEDANVPVGRLTPSTKN